MFSNELEELIEVAISDGELTDKKRQILFKRASNEGIDIDEFEMILDSRLAKKRKSLGLPTGASQAAPIPPVPPAPVAPPPTNQKLGGINKCPSCGAVVESGSIKCAECGHTFVNLQGNNSVQRFADMIREIETRHQTSGEGKTGLMNGLSKGLGMSSRKDEICSAIDTFPIPNSKEDLIEFICFLKPKAEKDKKSPFSKGVFSVVSSNPYGSLSKDKIAEAYKAKYEECLNKASLFLKNDPQFEELLAQNNIVLPGKKKRFGW